MPVSATSPPPPSPSAALTLDRCCEMQVRVLPKRGESFTAFIHAYNHHRKQIWFRINHKHSKDTCDILMLRSSAISRIEVIKDFPRRNGDSIETHFSKFKFQPQKLAVNDIQSIYKAKAAVQNSQKLQYQRRALAGELDGVGAFILFKLSHQYSPDVIKVDSKKSIVLPDLGITIRRPYLVSNCVISDPESTLETVESNTFLSIKKLVDNANTEYDDLNRGG